MKHVFMILLLTAGFACNNKKDDKDTTSTNNTVTNHTNTIPTPANSSNGTENPPPSYGGTGLIGTWKMDTEIFDDNGNRIIDEEERKKAYGNRYLLEINEGATCKIQGMFTGRWETKNEKGYPVLYIYRKKIEGEESSDPPPDVYGIIQMDATDLILQVMIMGEPSSFWLFKRQ